MESTGMECFPETLPETSPTCYYWQSEDDRLKPVYCIKAPAPEALLVLRKCNCKTHCTRKSCSSLKYSVQICVGMEVNTKTVLTIGQRYR